MKYTIVLLREPDGRYTVTVPALRGCVTWGDDVEDAVKQAREVIPLFLESLRDRDLPVPEDNPDVCVNMREAAEAIVRTVEIPEVAHIA